MSMRFPRGLTIALILSIGVFSSTTANAQAYCALRDPTTTIYHAFPDADSFQSIVKVVNNEARSAIHEKLPLDLHFNELGKHTIYVAKDGTTPIGIVHARSEGDRWGLTEIAWAFDLDFRIVDFKFQRIRNPASGDLGESGFRSRIIGMSFADLRDLLAEDAASFRRYRPSDNDAANDLGVTVVRSALKTIIVTETVWRNELRSIRAKHLLSKHFDRSVDLVLEATPYSASTQRALRQHQLDIEISIDRDKLIMYRVIDGNGKSLGFLFDSTWQSVGVSSQVFWLIDTDGGIIDVSSGDSDSDREFRDSLVQLVQFEAESAEQCSNTLELSALELSLLVRTRAEDRLPE